VHRACVQIRTEQTAGGTRSLKTRFNVLDSISTKTPSRSGRSRIVNAMPRLFLIFQFDKDGVLTTQSMRAGDVVPTRVSLKRT
jgi:hypothetical protein